MRFNPAYWAIAATTVVAPLPALAEPVQGAQVTTRAVPHPVVYDRVPHPVVYDTAKAAPEAAARIPHPVVYLDNTDTKAGAAPVVAPPNPDLDSATPDVANPAPGTTERPAPVVAAPAPREPSAASGTLATFVEKKMLVDLDETDWTGVATVYNARDFKPIWLDETGLTPKGRKLIAALEAADQWGLDPNHFKLPEIADAEAGADTLNPETWAELDLKITAAALRYASHARGGRILNPTEQLSSYLDRKPQLKDPAEVLENLVASADPSIVLHGLHPRHPQFEQLRHKYLALKAEAERPDIVRIPRGTLLRKDMKHAHVTLLRKRLKIAVVEPEDGSPFDPELFDDSVLEAVKTFQKDYGIATDGLVGNGTRRALNDVAVPDPKKLLANMEQWRWMPDDLGDTYIWVNIPEFKVRFIRDGNVVHTERIIAGKVSQQTPVFSDELETLYFHPKWHVPQSIKVNEIYPSLARGGSYFRRQNLRIAYNGRPVNPYNMDWSQRDIRNYHVYQPPGRGNVLGVVKFTFPNKHQVYMHDTPTKHLFKNKSRTYSHGCMRVRNPVRLAELIVEASNGWSVSDVDQVLKGPVQETPVKLDTKIPVHVTYFTAWVDESGDEKAANDIYGHEKKIKLALAGRFDKIAVGPDHLAPVKYKPRKQQYMGTTAVEDFFKNLFPGF